MLKYQQFSYKIQASMEYFHSSLHRMSERNISYYPPTIMSETKHAYRLRILLPGFSLEDFSLTIKDNVLLLKGGLAHEQNEKSKHVLSSSFMRAYTFEHCVEKEEVYAELKNGLLFIELQKKSVEKVEIIALDMEENEEADNEINLKRQ